MEKLNPRVYWKGDECDACIACADLLAFLTDAKLYSGYLKLEPDNVKKVWKPYSFDASVGVYSHSNRWSYAWYSNKVINIVPYIAKPTVFLSIDNLPDPNPSSEPMGPGTSGDDEFNPSDMKAAKPLPFHKIIKQSAAYDAAVCKAFELSGSLKIFKFDEDSQSVRDKDVFVYIGENSKRVGKALQDSADITVMSGLQLRRSIKVTN